MWFKFFLNQFVSKIKLTQQDDARPFLTEIHQLLSEYSQEREIETLLSLIMHLNNEYGKKDEGTVDLPEFKEFLFILVILYIKYSYEERLFTIDFHKHKSIMEAIATRLKGLAPSHNEPDSPYFIGLERDFLAHFKSQVDDPQKNEESAILEILELANVMDDLDDLEDLDEGDFEYSESNLIPYINKAEIALLRKLNYDFTLHLSDSLCALLLSQTDPTITLMLYSDLVQLKASHDAINPILSALETRISPQSLRFVPTMHHPFHQFLTKLGQLEDTLIVLIERNKAALKFVQKNNNGNRHWLPTFDYIGSTSEHLKTHFLEHCPIPKFKRFMEIIRESDQILKNLTSFSGTLLSEYNAVLQKTASNPDEVPNAIMEFYRCLSTQAIFYQFNNAFLKNSLECLVTFLAEEAPEVALVQALKGVYCTGLIQYDLNYFRNLHEFSRIYLEEVAKSAFSAEAMAAEDQLLSQLERDIRNKIPESSRDAWSGAMNKVVDALIKIKQCLIKKNRSLVPPVVNTLVRHGIFTQNTTGPTAEEFPALTFNERA